MQTIYISEDINIHNKLIQLNNKKPYKMNKELEQTFLKEVIQIAKKHENMLNIHYYQGNYFQLDFFKKPFRLVALK